LRIISDQLWAKVKRRQLTINQANTAIRAALHMNARDRQAIQILV
jgi:hypothetical protein